MTNKPRTPSDEELIDARGLDAILAAWTDGTMDAAGTIEDLLEVIEAQSATIVGLREHIAEQIKHVEMRIKDGITEGAVIWRIALEDVVRENRAALKEGVSDER